MRYSREMTPQEERYWIHALTRDGTSTAFLQNQVRHGQDLLQTSAKLAVCPRCEGVMLGDNKGHRCGACGTWVPKEKAHLLREYMMNSNFK